MNVFKTLKQKLQTVFSSRQNFRPKKLYEVLHQGHYPIDENTYQDLLLDEVNTKLNRCSTSYGDELLGHWLRNIKGYDDLSKLQRDTEKLQKSGRTPELVKILQKVGVQRRGNIISDLWDGFEMDSFLIRNILPIQIMNITALVVLTMMLGKYFFLWLILFFLINLVIYISTNSLISGFSGSINYLLNGIHGIKKMDRTGLDFLSVGKPQYRKFNHLQWCTLLFKDGLGGMTSEDPLSILMDYLRIFLSLEAISFHVTSKFILKNIQDIRQIILYLGHYDCVANNVSILEDFEAVPAVIEQGKEIAFTELYHPLMVDPVKQSKTINNGLIITGLNMAGKSTFMRTLGINQLLATSLGMAFCKNFKTDIFRIITSFRINDALLQNKSRYFAEAERLASIMENTSRNKCLCIIDEILSGTNSQDRIYGSTEILKRLAKNQDSIVISATHDVDIAKALENQYELGYFDGEMKDEKIFFDYTLKSGIVENRNGLLILNALGIDL